MTFYEYIHTYIPYLTLPYLTLPYLTLPYITLHTYINHCIYIHAIVCGIYIYIYTFLRVCASTRVTSDTWDPISPNVGNTVWAATSNRTPPRSRCCTKATQATRQCFKGGNGKSSLEIHHLMPLMEVISITKMEILTGNPLIVKPSNGERKVSLTHFD